MDEKLKLAGDQFARRHPGASRALGGIFDISYEELEKEQLALRTGILSLDMALGGGLAAGVVEIHGDESTGKTGLVGRVVTSAQLAGWATALCATEYLDVPYLRSLGVDDTRLAIVKGSIKDVEPIALDFVGANNRLLVIDSLTALRPAEESYENWNEEMFSFLSCISARCASSSLVLVTNQSRARKSIHPGRTFTRGTETAARRLTDLFNVRLELGRDHVARDTYTQVVHIESNVLARPAVLVTMPAKKGFGVDVDLDTLQVALEHNYIERVGAYYYLEGKNLGRGAAEAAATLRQTGLIASVQDTFLR